MKKKRFIGGTLPDRFNGNLNKNNTSKVRGVCFDKSRNKWLSYIMFKRKFYSLGRYNTIAEAEKARKLAEKDLLNKE